MLKRREARLARDSAVATRRLQEAAASIIRLDDEDLLDLADIFNVEPRGTIGAIAFAEVARRKLSL